MITYKSKKREIRDLQKLLLSLDLLGYSDDVDSGVWNDATQAAVVRLYRHLGWKHGSDDRWVTTPALAAITSAIHHHAVDAEHSTGPGTGGTGSHTGGTGSHTGGTGSHTGGTGSHTGGTGSHTGGTGSHTGGTGSHTGGTGSHTGGTGSHTGGGASPE